MTTLDVDPDPNIWINKWGHNSSSYRWLPLLVSVSNSPTSGGTSSSNQKCLQVVSHFRLSTPTETRWCHSRGVRWKHWWVWMWVCVPVEDAQLDKEAASLALVSSFIINCRWGCSDQCGKLIRNKKRWEREGGQPGTKHAFICCNMFRNLKKKKSDLF